MIDDVRGIIERGLHSLNDVLSEIRKLASYDDWRKREMQPLLWWRSVKRKRMKL
ncbi:MAG TPA: hypothetical protein PK811_04580 [bacterium]|nr:hypothetical protein [bacterium]